MANTPPSSRGNSRSSGGRGPGSPTATPRQVANTPNSFPRVGYGPRPGPPSPAPPTTPVTPPVTPAAPTPAAPVPPTNPAPAAASPPPVTPAAPAAAAAGGASGGLGLLPLVVGATVGAIVFLLGHEPAGEVPRPPEPPQKIEEEKYPFYGGQSKDLYTVLARVSTNQNSQEYSFQNIRGPITGIRIRGDRVQIQAADAPPGYENPEPNWYQTQALVPPYLQGGTVEIFRIYRQDGQPDTSGNPPPVVQPIYTTNITNVYSTPPAVGESTPPPPAIIIMPIGGGASAPVAPPAPSAPSNVPQLQPSYLPAANPSRRSGQNETDPDIASSSPAPGYPRSSKTPSSGITPEAAEASRNAGVQVTPSTGVPPEVAPVPEQGQRPNVDNPQRVPSFAGTPQAPNIDRESITQELLQIEQQLIQARSTISSLTPQSTSQSISEQIQQEERRLSDLRTNINTATPETISQRLQQAEQELQTEERRLTNLEPSATTALQRNQISQIRQRIIQLRNRINNPSSQPETPSQTQTQTIPELDRIRDQLTNVGIGIALLTPLVNPINNIATNTTPEALKNAARKGTCESFDPGGCNADIRQNSQNAANGTNELLDRLTAINQTLIPLIWGTTQTINNKLGAQMPGGVAGVLGRLSSSLGIDRVFNLINFLANLHNASMLSASLKVTLLEMLSSVGNATGLLQTSEGENVDLNNVFNQGIETFITKLIGVDAWASMKLSWRKYSSIYRAATNSLNAVSSMFNSIGEVLETTAEHTGKIGNAIRAAGLVRENAYNFMAEKLNVKTSRFMTFQAKVGGVAQVLETVNEIAENIVEGQEQYTEAVKATTEFKKELADAQKNPGIDNKALKEEAAKIKENLVKDPTGEDETGLLSFLTDK